MSKQVLVPGLFELRDRVRALEARVEAFEARVELGARALSWDALVFVSPRQVAEKLGVAPQTVTNWLARGLLPSFRIGCSRRVPAWWLTAKVAAPPEKREDLIRRVARASSREATRSAAAALQERARRALEAGQAKE